MRRARRADASFTLIVLLAFALLVGAALYGALWRSGSERRARQDEQASEGARSSSVKLAEAVEMALREATFEATEEVAAHGGYRRELVPPVSFEQIPYWFQGGRMTQVPSAELMRSMLRDEVDSRLREKLQAMEKLPQHMAAGLRARGQEVSVELGDAYVSSTATVVLEHGSGGAVQTQTYTPSATLELRLKHLRDLMEQAFSFLARNESVERHFIYFIRQDPRFPIPEGLPEITCKEEYVHKRNLYAPMEDDLRLALSQTLLHLRRNESVAGRGAEVMWRMDAVRTRIGLSLVDHFGNRDLVHKWVARRTYPCIRTWQAWYNFTLPTLVSVVDLRKTSKVLLGQEVSAAAGLTFNALYLGEVRENQIFRSAGTAGPGGCLGACSMNLTVLGVGGDAPSVGGGFMDVCDLGSFIRFPASFKGSVVENVPCGTVQLSLAPSDAGSFELSSRVVSLREGAMNNVTVRLTAASSLGGRVVKRASVLCGPDSAPGCRNAVVSRSDVGLRFVRGSPDRYVSVHLASLDEPDLRYTAVTDEEGNYTFPRVRSGWYVAAALPSQDDAGNFGYRVLPFVGRVLVRAGENVLPIVMEPVTPVVKDGATVLVDAVERCPSC